MTFIGTVRSARPGSATCSGQPSGSYPPRQGNSVTIPLRIINDPPPPPPPTPRGTISISSDPSGARIRIGRQSHRTTPRTLSLPPGTYDIQLSKPCYATQVRRATVRRGRTETLIVELPPDSTTCGTPTRVDRGVTFVGSPDSILVKVNGVREGYTPLTLRLPVGRHHLTFEREGYYAEVDSIIIVRRDSLYEVRIGLEIKVGVLEAHTYPAGATLIIENDSVATPYTGQLPLNPSGTRTYPYRIEKPGYETVTGEIQVDDVYESVIDTALTPLAGWIRARSQPIGASVLIDGVEMGQAPLDMRVIPGSYAVVIQSGAHIIVQQTVAVTTGSDTRVGEGPDPIDFDPLLPDTEGDGEDNGHPPPPPPPRPGTAIDELLAEARQELEHGRYDSAYTLYEQAQDINRSNREVFEAISKLESARTQVAALTVRQRGDREILHRNMYEDAVSRDCQSFRSATAELARMVTNDPASFLLIPRACSDWINPGGGPSMDLVYVYGSSEYRSDDPRVQRVENPPFVGFQLSATEITNAQFARFLHETRETRDADGKRMIVRDPVGIVEDRRDGWMPIPGMDDLPVVDATWYGANAYAQWAGGRLPRLSEWLWAFAIGAAEADEPVSGNWKGTASPDRWELEVAPVKQFAPDGLGLYDMAGNAWEWIDYESSDTRDKRRTILGGSYRTDMGRARDGASGGTDADQNNGEIGFRLLIPLD